MTRLQSQGGFLNRTMRRSSLASKRHSSTTSSRRSGRHATLGRSTSARCRRSWNRRVLHALSVEVTFGGATVFVLDVARYERL